MDTITSQQTANTLNIALKNNSNSSNVYAYITGRALNSTSSLVLLQADGKTPYYPTSPSSTSTPLPVNCAIKLGSPGTIITVTVPRTAGGRIWFCINSTLTFLLNPGPALVEPSVSNPSDPNYNKTWGFCEFTFNEYEAFVNISYVDFVCLPISLELKGGDGVVSKVGGLNADGLKTVCDELLKQDAKDGAGWGNLVVKSASGKYLRALSPNTGIVMNSGLSSGYYANYVNAVWSKYTNASLTINTQSQWGNVSGKISNNLLTFPSVGTFAKPSAADIFSCSTGPFAYNPVNTQEMGNLGARLAAAFNRSTLLMNDQQPDGEDVSKFYKEAVTNHYSRIVHSVNDSGRGYAFPYDDVGATGAGDQSGSVSDGNPQLLTVGVGGNW